MRISKHISVCYHVIDPAVVGACVAAAYISFYQMKYLRMGIEFCGKAIAERLAGSNDDK